ncbi:patatin-like phospholipase domain-containing protein 2 [Penaeus indicus]|uniref:patatin-like phospholipase domain-containing protein 2 n=1 Tax=Penaeus indicus TaxID=29960 RepID=UPI00300CF148
MKHKPEAKHNSTILQLIDLISNAQALKQKFNLVGIITSSVLKTATEARKRMLGPFSPTFNVEKLLREGLLSVLPDDAHKIVSGKLFISVTRVSDGKNILLSHFETREELIQALLCSAFIPGFSGWACPKVGGVRYIDGGFTDNLPEVDAHTVTVAPFCGEADICPKDNTAGLITVSLANTSIELSKENLYRFARILFPPPPEVLNKMCQQGFNDALDFLQRNNLINCTRCLAVQSRFNLTETHEDTHLSLHDMDCLDCSRQRNEAILDQLPEAVGCILQDAINKANQGLMNWVFKHRSMKLLSVLTLPYILPIDIAYAAFLKFMSSTPSASDLKTLGKQIVDLVQALMQSTTKSSLYHHHHHHDSKFSCQLAITEFSGDTELHNRHNFDFTLDLDDLEGVPESHKDAMALESEALSQVALRCAVRSMSRPGSRMASRAASRAVSRAVSRRPSVNDLTNPEELETALPVTTTVMSDDAFEQILDVTTHQEALMAYYYLDDNNEVRVTEIFDMTETDGGNGGGPHDDSYGGIEIDSETWHSEGHWSQRSRTDSMGSEGYHEGGLSMSIPSDTESEHGHRVMRQPESEQIYSSSPKRRPSYAIIE